MRKKIFAALGIIISLSLIAVVIVNNSTTLHSALAADTPSPAPAAQPSPDITSNCTTEMRKFLPPIQEDFLKYLQDTFKGDEPNSGKVGEAVDKFYETKNAIEAKYSQLLNTASPSGNVLEVTATPSSCKILADDAITALREVLKSHALKTTSSKTTTQMLEKYKEINKKLKDLNQNFGKLKGYIDSFNSKMPCYIKK
jgi:hypothetical protein